MLKTKCIQNLLFSVGCLLMTSGSLMAETAGKPPLKSPVGMAREVMSSGFVMQVFSGLAIVLVCVVGLAWMMRRFGRLQSSANGALRMIDGLALSTRERIVLVQVGDTQLLLGVAPGRVDTLHVLGEPLPASMEERTAGVRFSSRLKDALGAEQ